ncbi:MAG: GlgB N-terminal domain-containing protein [Planctomycetota bacterium]|jgi:1,4-alpha-glucan branching enzyme
MENNTISYPELLDNLPEEDLRKNYPWRYFGAQVTGSSTVFRIFLPEAEEVELLREGNNWGENHEPLTRLEDGVWQIEVPEVLTNAEYKYRIKNNKDYLEKPYDMARLDPFSLEVTTHYGEGESRIYNSVVKDHELFEWTNKKSPVSNCPMSVYELHLGAFMDDNYQNIAVKIVEHLKYLEFTHIQVMPPFQTPIHESWGYLVSTPYAIYNRHGSLYDFKWFVNHLHENGFGVIVDVPFGFSIQDWDSGIANIDGSDIYHHSGEKGWNRQWNTRIYNHTNPYVEDYLCGICSYLHNELGIDGARIDAVSAQIFKDYDRGTSDWVRNNKEEISSEDWDLIGSLGGDMNLEDRGYWISEALDIPVLHFFRNFHQRLNFTSPAFFTIAEESRRVFPRLATPVSEGGLGFTYAQNMGEMHRVRKYLHKCTEERKIEEIESLMLKHTPEVFVNAMNTHDECANGRERLITELKSHIQLIGLASFCWFRPGAPMIFMGDEFCEEGWFDVNHHLDWGKTGPGAPLHCQQMTNCFHDLNYLLRREPALSKQESWSMDRNGSNNEHKWFSFVRWAGDAKWDSNNHDDHRNDIVFIRSENHDFISQAAEIYVLYRPAPLQPT